MWYNNWAMLFLAARRVDTILSTVALITLAAFAARGIAPSSTFDLGPLHFGAESLYETLADLKKTKSDIADLKADFKAGRIKALKHRVPAPQKALLRQEAEMAQVEMHEAVAAIEEAALAGKGATAGAVADLKSAVTEVRVPWPEGWTAPFLEIAPLSHENGSPCPRAYRQLTDALPVLIAAGTALATGDSQGLAVFEIRGGGRLRTHRRRHR